MNPFRTWLYKRKAERIERRLKLGMPFKESELVYAAYARCHCGAGMAYPIGIGLHGFWDCSAILKGEAIPTGQPGSVRHEARMPFAFYEVKSEKQPSTRGVTTRPARV